MPMRFERLPKISCLALLFCFLAASAEAIPVFTVGSDAFQCDFTDLDAALAAVPDGVRLQLSAGTYLVDHLTRNQSVWISGGHDGCGGAQLPGVRSILDGDKVGQIMDLGAGDPTWVILDQLELRNGRGGPLASSPAPASGAGVRVLGPVQLYVSDVIFRNNWALVGGALDLLPTANGAPQVVVSDSQFLSNGVVRRFAVPAQGGAIRCLDGELTIRRSTFSNNYAEEDGGALALEGCDTTIFDSTFGTSRTHGRGGAIFSRANRLDLGDGGDRDVHLVDNTADRGGAVYASEAVVIVDGVRFAGNSARVDGGGLYAFESDLVVGRFPCAVGGCVRFEGDEADGVGGAMALRESAADLFGVISDGATAVADGAFLWADSGAGLDIEMASSVVTGGDGASLVFSRTASKVRVLSSTFYDNPSVEPVLDLDDAESHVSHVIFSGNGGPPTQQNPDFFTCNLLDGPFAPPGNSQNTVFGDPLFVAGDFHLQANVGSPAVDACPFGLFEVAFEDIDGELRPDPAGWNDIGADELF